MDTTAWADFANELRRILGSIPAMDYFDNRTALVHGLPAAPVDYIKRDMSKGGDLRNIVNGAEGMGVLPKGEHALVVVARNALEFVEGLTVESALQELIAQAQEDVPSKPDVANYASFRTRIPNSKAVKLRGRDDDLAMLCDKLKAGGSAAVVRAMGGMGKTELAIAVANTLAPDFDGRVIWLDCGMNSVQVIQERMADAVGIQFTPELSIALRTDRIHGVLGAAPAVLVVLDDIREAHLADFDYLRPPAHCPLLVTSRRMDVPLPAVDRLDIKVLNPDAAWALFEDNLKQTARDEETTVKRLAKFLDYVPLALSLAVRQIEALLRRRKKPDKPVAMAYADLRQRCRVLDMGDDPNQSVRATFDISYEELPPDDQRYLRWLGLFARSTFELAHVAELWQVEEDEAVVILTRLYKAGLVEQEDADHWWMHDLLREYALLKLEEGDDLDPARKRYARLWADVLNFLDQPRSLVDYRYRSAFKIEVQQAATWVFERFADDADLVVAMARGLYGQYNAHDFVRTWEQWIQSGYEAGRAQDDVNTMYVLELTRALGRIRRQQGEIEEASRLYQEAIEGADAWEQAEEDENQKREAQNNRAVTLGELGRLKAQGGDVTGALALHEEELQVYEQLGDVRSRAASILDIARLKTQAGDVEGAMADFNVALKLFEQLGDVRSRAVTLGDIARLKAQGGDVTGALLDFQEVLAICENIDEVRGRAVTLGDIARLKADQGDVAGALALHEEELQVYEQLGDVQARAATLGDIARLKSQVGDVTGALALHEEELQVYEQLGDVRSRATTLGDIARLKADQGDVAGALALHEEELQVYEQLGDVLSRAMTLGDIARLKADQGDVAGALVLHEEELQVYEQLGDARERAIALANIGTVYYRQGDKDKAREYLLEARDEFERLGFTPLVESVDSWLKLVGE